MRTLEAEGEVLALLEKIDDLESDKDELQRENAMLEEEMGVLRDRVRVYKAAVRKPRQRKSEVKNPLDDSRKWRFDKEAAGVVG